MKIKRKVEMNLPQLIEWVIENKKFGCTYISDNFNKVYVTDDGIIEFNGSFYRDVFTIITFEEITEDTKVSKLAHYSTYGFKGTKNNTSINDVKDDNSIAFYIMNCDRTMTLIWTKEKGLVE